MLLGTRPAAGRFLRPSQTYTWSMRLRISRSNIHTDGRNRASNLWTPTLRVPKQAAQAETDINDWFIRAGLYRKAYSGIFHMLPLGLRVQDKLERLIDRHMQSVGASKISLSSISSQELWEQSGRLTKGSEVFRFQDRKEFKFLLAPTHEEEITALAGSLTASYRDLPLRVYQISRKYRDEARPRQGLLRGREFIMKDLYTFDFTVEEALKTYELVKSAYTRLFDELKLPYLTAAADSGNMGGSLSHEFHFPSPRGEDTVVSCSNCDSVYNEELADGKALASGTSAESTPGFDVSEKSEETNARVSTGLWMAISKDRKTLIRSWYPKFTVEDGVTDPVRRQVNSHAVKSIANAAGIDIDISIKNPLEQWAARANSKASSHGSTEKTRVVDMYDNLVHAYTRPPRRMLQEAGCAVENLRFTRLDTFPGTSNRLNLVNVLDGDQCPKCTQGKLKTHTAIELGHTFHLGTRYSEVLQATVKREDNKSVPMQMGCHGIGVSRMIAAVADCLVDNKGLNWPRAIAPFEVAIVPATDDVLADAEMVYDHLVAGADAASSTPVDAIIDDRAKNMGWKMGDADLIGYPVIVVLGRGWKEKQTLEVQCRRLGLRQDLPLDELSSVVRETLAQL
ncbi:putative proline--tRNA ligase AIM10 [Aspergillus stella-maris]|uniref:putative proline--tRNA ligase AIM10 n=1 Tax=Aspergillus stella-maris TaxID=1810926 RepID=UPI003CCC91D2